MTLDDNTKSASFVVNEGVDTEVLDYLRRAIRTLSPNGHLESLEIQADLIFSHDELNRHLLPHNSLAILDAALLLGKLQSLNLHDYIAIGNYYLQKIAVQLPELRYILYII